MSTEVANLSVETLSHLANQTNEAILSGQEYAYVGFNKEGKFSDIELTYPNAESTQSNKLHVCLTYMSSGDKIGALIEHPEADLSIYADYDQNHVLQSYSFGSLTDEKSPYVEGTMDADSEGQRIQPLSNGWIIRSEREGGNDYLNVINPNGQQLLSVFFENDKSFYVERSFTDKDLPMEQISFATDGTITKYVSSTKEISAIDETKYLGDNQIQVSGGHPRPQRS